MAVDVELPTLPAEGYEPLDAWQMGRANYCLIILGQVQVHERHPCLNTIHDAEGEIYNNNLLNYYCSLTPSHFLARKFTNPSDLSDVIDCRFKRQAF